MVTVLTESQHTGEFVVSEAGGRLSRSANTLLSGEKVSDGDIMITSGGKMHKLASTDFDTDGNLIGFAGLVLGDWDASATGANADVKDVPVIDCLAEVHEIYVGFPTDAGEKAAVVAAMLAALIKVR